MFQWLRRCKKVALSDKKCSVFRSAALFWQFGCRLQTGLEVFSSDKSWNMSENCNLIANRGLPHINEHIFSFLDDWSLTQIRGVCQDWKEFVDVYYSKFFYRRLRKRCENDEQFLNRCAIEGFLYVFQVLTRNFKHCSEINPRDDEGWRLFQDLLYELDTNLTMLFY